MTFRSPALTGLILFVTILLSSCASTLTRDELAVEYFNLGTAYYEIGDLNRSAEYLSRAIQLDESLARASYNLARVYVQQGRLSDADELLTSLLAEDPANAILLATKGYVAYINGDLEIAAIHYDKAITEDPGDADLLYNRAIIADEIGDIELAATRLRAARQIQPENRQILRRLGAAERKVGNSEEAIDAWLAYLDRGGADGEVELLLAELYEEGAYYDRALEVIEAVVQRGSDGPLIISRARFQKASILLTAAEESELGIAALQAALAAGFSDTELIQELLLDDRLIERPIVEQLLKDADVFPTADDLSTAPEGATSDAVEPALPQDEAINEGAVEPPPIGAE